MSIEDQKRMWDIDHKAQLGDKITEEERYFFNSNFDKMRYVMQENHNHWKFHSNLI